MSIGGAWTPQNSACCYRSTRCARWSGGVMRSCGSRMTARLIRAVWRPATWCTCIVGMTPRCVSVHCIGVDLALPERYRHEAQVDFLALPDRIRGFDIGIAPLADTPYNRGRADIKLEEWAACGVPWLASPVGPYLELGEAQGGRLVPDALWVDALERMASSRRERRSLGRAARRWARARRSPRSRTAGSRCFSAPPQHARGPRRRSR